MAKNNKYQDWSKTDLLKEIERLNKRKKYGLVWEDKPEDVVEQCKKKLPVLEEDSSRVIETSKDEPVNMLIEGDNYHALSVLNYTHKGKVDAIYIDPPYNTGARDWKYNNNYVDAEDPYRHSKWISFMFHRLRLAKNVLKNTGIICVTVDDYEMPRLWLLLEEVFGEKNHLGTVAIRINPGGRKSKRKVAAQHEYALFFSKTASVKVAKIEKSPDEKSHSYKKDDNGNWYEERNLRKDGADSLAKPDSARYYPIYYDPKLKKISTSEELPVEILPLDTRGRKRIWRRSKEDVEKMFNRGEVFIKETKYGTQVYFKFRGGLKGETPKSFWEDAKFSASEHGTQILNRILGKREAFPYPKSPYAVERCIEVCTSNKNAIILDFFAGSGTTAQAVLNLNKRDDGNRKFILCTNNENEIAKEICHPRVKNIIKGYKSRNKQIKGLGGNLKYFKTTFVDANQTDKNKHQLTQKATDMLCIKEATYELVKSTKNFKIFTNGKKTKYTGIVYDQLAIPEFKDEIAKIEGPFSVYIFSLADDTFEEEFADISNKVTLSPIPESILRVYRRIFK